MSFSKQNPDAYSPSQTSNKSPLSPMINQMMRKDKEIQGLRQELSQLQRINQQCQLQIEQLEEELGSRVEKYNAAQDQIKHLLRRLEAKDKNANSNQFPYPKEFEAEEVLGSPFDNTLRGLPQQVGSSKQNRSQSLQGNVLIKATVHQFRNNCETQPLLAKLNQRQNQEINESKTSAHPQSNSLTYEIQLHVLKETLTREKVLRINTEKFATQIILYNEEMERRNIHLQDKLKEYIENSEKELTAIYEEMLLYKEKCRILVEFFDGAKKISHQTKQQDKLDHKFLNDFNDQFGSFYNELNSLYQILSKTSLNSEVIQESVQQMYQVIKKMEDLQIQFLQTIQSRKQPISHEPPISNFMNNLLDIMNLSLEESQEFESMSQTDILNRIRKLITQSNRHNLERIKQDEEVELLLQKIQHLENQLDQKDQTYKKIASVQQREKSNEDDILRKLNIQLKLNKEQDFQLNLKISQLTELHKNNEQLKEQVKIFQNEKEINHQNLTKMGQELQSQVMIMKEQQVRIEDLQHEIQHNIQQKEMIRIHQNELYQTEIEVIQQRFEQSFHDFQKNLENKHFGEINELRCHHELVLQQQEQYFNQLFDNMQYSLKEKQRLLENEKEKTKSRTDTSIHLNYDQDQTSSNDKQLLACKKSKQILVGGSENQSSLINLTQIANSADQTRNSEKQKSKFKSYLQKKIKDFDTTIQYLYEISRGYIPNYQQYLIQSSRSLHDIKELQEKIDVIFYKNPELQQFIKKIETNIVNLYLQTMKNTPSNTMSLNPSQPKLPVQLRQID